MRGENGPEGPPACDQQQPSLQPQSLPQPWLPQPLPQPQLLPPTPLLPQPQQQKRMRIRMIHRQLLPPQPLFP